MTRHFPVVVRTLLAVVFVAMAATNPARGEPLESFDGRITRSVLDDYLSRAVTMEGLLHEHGSLENSVRFLRHVGARFAGRTLYLWGGERNLDALLETARFREGRLHRAMPELMLQAAIFEIVTEDVDELTLPAWVAKEFGEGDLDRTFSYEAMLFPSGKFRNHWRKGASVPDITQIETQMWFYYLATRYIDAGIEAIHFGQVALMGASDRKHQAWESLLARVRSHARRHARRGIVICDAHVPSGGLLVGERLLLDFHSFPLRVDEVPDRPLEGTLRMGYRDSLYGRSKGGIAPSGWTCEHLPYLVEFDNFGRSRREGQNIGGHWIWGYDEITWFAHMPREQRDRWLRHAWRWIREHDPNGHLQMPGSRTMAVPIGDKTWYWASHPNRDCPTGFGDEATIREIWNEADAVEKNAALELRRRCLGIIRDTLRDASSWPKVHAAEYLIWLDNPDGVKEVYLEELERSGEEPEYRIGIWRVLAQAATTPEERTRWIDRIVEAWRDPNSPDRRHATETLAKLGYAMPDRDRGILARDADSDDPILQAFARWLELNSGRADGMQRLIELLDSEEASSRKLAAFALRWQDELPIESRDKLVTTALREPAESPARLHLLSSAYVRAPVGYLCWIKEELVAYTRHGTEADKTEMCNALAERVTRDDLPLLQSLLEDKTMDVPATAARAILELDRKQRNQR